MSAWLVVGLGNPGPEYAGTRHNLGAVVVCELARRYAGGPSPSSSQPPVTSTNTEYLRRHRTRSRVAQVRLTADAGAGPGVAAVLAVPTAYMNESGGPVKALLRFYGVGPERLVVVHDEMDIPAGAIRLKQGGGEGGHNGLRSVTASVGTRDYFRVRVGIGRPPGRMDPTDFLLHDFSRAEREGLPVAVSDAADATVDLVTVGLVPTQQKYHILRPESGKKLT
ncbi:MAG: aminoacyl-tRNA hydrolase [Dermatophilaceae bacterium]